MFAGTPVMVPRDEDKDKLPAAAAFVQAPRYHWQESKWRVLGLVALLAGLLTVASRRYVDFPSGLLSFQRLLDHRRGAKICPQSDPLYPKQHAEVWESLKRDFDEETFRTRAVEWLVGAVRIPYVAICDVAFTLSSETVANKARSRTTRRTRAQLAWTRDGKPSGRSMITSFGHFPLRTISLTLKLKKRAGAIRTSDELIYHFR